MNRCSADRNGAALLLTATLLLSACGQDSAAPATPLPGPPAATIAPSPAPADRDDHGNSADQATPLAPGDFASGRLDRVSDLDLFRLIPLQERARYRLTVEAVDAAPLRLRLTDDAGFEQQRDLAESGAVAALEFTADFGDQALLWLWSPASATGSYRVWLEPLRAADYAQAWRLLRQATFGPTPAELDWVKNHGAAAWVDRQRHAGSAYQSDEDGRLSHLQRMIFNATTLEPGADWFPRNEDNPNAPAEPYFNGSASRHAADHQMSAWFHAALEGQDQLRQRMAFALSQILVVSTDNAQLSQRPEAVAHYADILARHALGSFRELLGDVARSPAMGFYLSHQGNEKANPRRNTLPDENFARELMQLFTIGLYELQPDGQPRLDAQGQLQPSYDQQDIEEMARVMTGWDLRYNSAYGRSDGSHVEPMEFNPDFHDDGEKRVLGQIIPAGLAAGTDLDLALDILFGHPNTAPFISHQLIQRLVSSNPSPAYVGRVARVFADNGAGQRGDLAAVARAILLDPEARGLPASAAAGKLDEPLLGLTRWLRAFAVRPVPGWRLASEFAGEAAAYDIYWVSAHGPIGQGAFRAPHVFNFFDPDFVPQDSFYQQAPAVLPELQIRTPNNIAGLVESSLLHRGFLETQWIRQSHGSVADFVAATNGEDSEDGPFWRRHANLALLDYGPALIAMEQALEGDSDGDFARLHADERDASGRTPRQRAISGLLNDLQHRLLGDVDLAPAYRQQLLQAIDRADTFALGPGREREEALRLCAALVQYLLLSPEYWVLR